MNVLSIRPGVNRLQGRCEIGTRRESHSDALSGPGARIPVEGFGGD